jgi:sugar lactone lactonase YvrE
MSRTSSALLIAFLCLGCGGKVLVDPGDGSETHFVCSADQDCASLGGPYRCVQGYCESALPSRFEQQVVWVDAAVDRAPAPPPSELRYPANIAVDGVNAYVTTGAFSSSTYTDDAVMKQPIGGGPVTALATTRSPAGLALDATHVYFTSYPSLAAESADRSLNAVMKIPIGGGQAVTLASGERAPSGIAVDDTHVYWTNAVDLGTVMKIPKHGGTATTLASGIYYPNAIAVDGTHAYWITGNEGEAGGSVMKVSKDGGTPIVLASALTPTHCIALGPTDVYYAGFDPNLIRWSEWPYEECASVGRVLSVPKSGGAPVSVASDQGCPMSIAVDASGVFWVNDGTYALVGYGPAQNPLYSYNEDGAVMAVPKTGGSPTALASALHHPSGLAVDAASVYWTSSGYDGAIVSTPKNPADGGGSR